MDRSNYPHGQYTSQYPLGVHYVYTLAYPDGKVFYVGKGQGNRIDDHEDEAHAGGTSYKCNVIRKIWANGGQVAKRAVATFDTHEEAIQYEIALIFFMDGLTNKTYGGEGMVGFVHSAETRQKFRERTKRQWESEEFRRKFSLAKTGMRASEETKRKMSAA